MRCLQFTFINLYGSYSVVFASYKCFYQSENVCRLVSKYAGRKYIINNPRISYLTLSYEQAISNSTVLLKELMKKKQRPLRLHSLIWVCVDQLQYTSVSVCR